MRKHHALKVGPKCFAQTGFQWLISFPRDHLGFKVIELLQSWRRGPCFGGHPAQEFCDLKQAIERADREGGSGVYTVNTIGLRNRGPFFDAIFFKVVKTSKIMISKV